MTTSRPNVSRKGDPRKGSAGSDRSRGASSGQYERDSQRRQGARKKTSSRQGASLPGLLIRSATKTPRRILTTLLITVLLVAMLCFYGCDGITNYGVIHQGVQVGLVQVSHLTKEDATELINTELGALATTTPLILYDSEESSAAGANDNTVELGSGVNDVIQTGAGEKATSWSISPATLDASVSASELAQEAYEVGREGDFFLGRLAASIFGVTVEPRLTMSEERLASLQEYLTLSLGTPMNNASMNFDGTRFVAEDGHDGRVVDSEQFEAMLQRAFFSERSEDRGIVVPLVDSAMQVSLESAQAAAERAQQSIAQPVILTYLDTSWTLNSEQLGQLITTTIEQDESGTWQLVPSVDANLLRELMPGIVGQISIEGQIAPVNASYAEEEGVLQIVPGVDGTGIDYPRLSQDMNAALFGEGQNNDESTNTEGRVIPLQIGTLSPDFNTNDAEAFDFSTKISEFTIDYHTVPDTSVVNIHVTADHLNSSIIPPQATWSLIETVGEITEANGFVNSDIIVDGEYTQGVGGGTCTVATTVFNAVYEAGYPIVERVSHFLRATRYPLGRDAAIAAPVADLKFQNDTDNYLLLTMSYTDTTVTCTLWGVPPGYTVESIEGELIEGADYDRKEIVDESLAPGERVIKQEGMRASQVSVTRIVYDAAGNIKSEGTFYSAYNPTTEITLVGS